MAPLARIVLLVVLRCVLFDPQYIVGRRYIGKEGRNDKADADYMEPFWGRALRSPIRRTSGACQGPKPKQQPDEVQRRIEMHAFPS
jgi:hypothetical protein